MALYRCGSSGGTAFLDDNQYTIQEGTSSAATLAIGTYVAGTEKSLSYSRCFSSLINVKKYSTIKCSAHQLTVWGIKSDQSVTKLYYKTGQTETTLDITDYDYVLAREYTSNTTTYQFKFTIS